MDNVSMNALIFIFRFNDRGFVVPPWMSHLFRDIDSWSKISSLL